LRSPPVHQGDVVVAMTESKHTMHSGVEYEPNFTDLGQRNSKDPVESIAEGWRKVNDPFPTFWVILGPLRPKTTSTPSLSVREPRCSFRGTTCLTLRLGRH
jgi:hypothetical protein